VESTETAYERAIDKLAAEAKPRLENPATPLLANYHEKLLVLDGALRISVRRRDESIKRATALSIAGHVPGEATHSGRGLEAKQR